MFSEELKLVIYISILTTTSITLFKYKKYIEGYKCGRIYV